MPAGLIYQLAILTRRLVYLLNITRSTAYSFDNSDGKASAYISPEGSTMQRDGKTPYREGTTRKSGPGLLSFIKSVFESCKAFIDDAIKGGARCIKQDDGCGLIFDSEKKYVVVTRKFKSMQSG